MADIFVSYAREDSAKAAMVARALEAQGYDVFWDSEIPPGQTWADYIEAKLSQSKVMVVLWSQHSAGSQWVREEARIGRDKGKLIPAQIDGTPAPFGFGEVQAADLSTWTGAGDHPGWRAFAGAVGARVGEAARMPRSEPGPSPELRPQAFAAGASAVATDPANMSPLDYVKKCFRLYFNANGRARRAEYWWWVAFTFGVGIVTGAVDMVAFGATSGMQPISTLASLALAPAGVCVAIRRWHDVGLSGWLFLGALIAVFFGAGLSMELPEVGGLLGLAAVAGMLLVAVIPSRDGANTYGPNPKTGAADMADAFT